METVPLQNAFGDMEPRVDFDFDAVDAKPEAPRGDLAVAEGLARLLLHHVIRCPGGPKPWRLQQIGIRALLLAEILAPTGDSLTDFAASWGLSKQLLAFHSTRMTDGIGLPFPWSKSDAARAMNRACQLGLLEGTWEISSSSERNKLARQRRAARAAAQAVA